MDSGKQKVPMDEPLLNNPPPAPGENRGARFSWLTFLGFAFLTFNSVMAVYRSNGDRAAIAFVAFSYLDLILLFYCLRRYEQAPPGRPRREEDIRMAVWLLSTMLVYAVFMLLVFWFADTGASAAERGIVAPPQQHQYPSSVPAPPWP